MTLSLNERAQVRANQLIADPEGMGVAIHQLENGCRLIDCGVDVPGGLEAGRLFAEACLGGLGSVSFTHLTVDGWWLPGLTVRSDHPTLACMGAQYAGWAINKNDYFAMGSGPARALVRAETKLYDELGYSDPAKNAVLCLETRTLPPLDIAAFIAERAGVVPEKLTLLVAPTASPVGSVQIAARVVETGLHKLHELGFDLHQVLTGFGTCPLPPIAKNDMRGIGRTNDAVLYGGQVHYFVRADDDELAELTPKVPSSTSSDYGEPFYDTFKRYKFDFYQIDPLLFSPAEIFVTNVASGRTFHAGQTNGEVLKQSFLG
jgi:methenyltetrahydromethanopterin cyclohydrolase